MDPRGTMPDAARSGNAFSPVSNWLLSQKSGSTADCTIPTAASQPFRNNRKGFLRQIDICFLELRWLTQ